MKLRMLLLMVAMGLGASALAECPGEDAEPAFSVKTKEGPTLFLCGFEDRGVPTTKGKRAFSDFTIYFQTEKTPAAQKVFAAENNETYWAKGIGNKSIELEELWFFGEKPQSAFKSEITCTAEACKVSESKCVLKLKPNPFPKALKEFEERQTAGTLEDEGEDLLDQIFAQAFTGDKAAKSFYEKEHAGLDAALLEAFNANRKKLEVGCKR